MGDGQLITAPIDSEPNADGQDGSSAKFSLSEYFDKECGYYMHLGMSPELYWDGDCQAVRWYREKHRYDLEELTFRAWLQGKYIYDALLFASPALKPFLKNPKPIDYHENPYPLTARMDRDLKRAEDNKKIEVGLAAFKAIAMKANEHLNKEQGGDEQEDGDRT